MEGRRQPLIVRLPPREPFWLSVALGRTASDAGERDPTRGVLSRFWTIKFFPDENVRRSETGTSDDSILLDNESLMSWIGPVPQPTGPAKPGKSSSGTWTSCGSSERVAVVLDWTIQCRISLWPKRGENGAPTSQWLNMINMHSVKPQQGDTRRLSLRTSPRRSITTWAPSGACASSILVEVLVFSTMVGFVMAWNLSNGMLASLDVSSRLLARQPMCVAMRVSRTKPSPLPR